jgi:peroxiredoxin
VLTVGDRAPSFSLPDASTGEPVSDPWASGPAVIIFFKVTCPVCHMVAPKVTAMAERGVPVVAIGQDPPSSLVAYGREKGQRARTLSDVKPYPVSSAFGISSVPTLFAVRAGGEIAQAVGGWDRKRWNAVAVGHGAPPVSSDDDGLPFFRPG